MESNRTLKKVIVSCEDKSGLVDNSGFPDLPVNGLLGYLRDVYSSIIFLSSGGTYELLKKHNFNVIRFEEYTKSPQMKDGLVKSIDYKIHGAIMAQDYNYKDTLFLKENDLYSIDGVITNFNVLDIGGIESFNKWSDFERFRERIDLGGPLMCMTARKGFLNTLLLTNPKDYLTVIDSINENNGKCTMKLRIEMAKKGSNLLRKYQKNICDLYEKLNEDLLLDILN